MRMAISPTLETGHLQAAGDRLAAADAVHRQGARRIDGSCGLMFQPTNLDPSKKYPIVNQIYPGPRRAASAAGSFRRRAGMRKRSRSRPWSSRSTDGDAVALEEIPRGVLQRHGRQTRDQVAGMKHAERHAWIDINRAGIYGHSGGGYATASHVPLSGILQGRDLGGRQP
jgi:hypothetical protein